MNPVIVPAFALMLDRLEAITRAAPPEDVADAPTLLATLSADGVWPDIAYEGTTSPGFKAFPHILRMVTLAHAVSQAADGEQRRALTEGYARALAAWIRLGLVAHHSWYHTIGVPMHLWHSLVLMRHHLTHEQVLAALPVLCTSDHHGVTLYCGTPATGANLIWSAVPQMVAGLLSGNEATVRRAVNECLSEVRCCEEEGIQVDGSFHQHGPQLYSGGYGNDFTYHVSMLAYVLHGTPFAFSPEHLDVVARQVLDGQQWMLRGMRWDFGVIGREIVRQRQTCTRLAESAAFMVEADPSRAASYRALAGRIRGEGEAAPLTGNRLFHRSDFMTHTRPGWYASARMSSTRIFGTEAGNGENVRGFHLGDGVTCLLRDGEEYAAIFPLWDWCKLPGLTAAETTEVYPHYTWGEGSHGGTPFAGGVSNGRFGAAGMILDRVGTAARKAWFFFDDHMVCLGAGITRDADAVPVVTTLNQAQARGPVLCNGVPVDGTQAVNFPGWLHHDRWGYVVPGKATGVVQREQRSGSWTDIGKIEAQSGGDTFTDGVFCAWLEHGPRPVDGTYAYAIWPDVAAEAMPERVARCQQECYTVSTALLAASDTRAGVAAAIFFAPGSAQLLADLTVAVDRPCAVLVSGTGEQRRLYLASPDQQTGTVTLRINDGDAIRVVLPDGAAAGSSVAIAG